jgi:hypothetical protein
MATSGCSMGPSPARNKDDAKKQLDVMKGLVRQLKDENVRLRKKNELERAYFESCLTRMASIRGSLDGLTEEIPERLDDAERAPPRSVVLVGVTGSGKSSVGSTILGCYDSSGGTNESPPPFAISSGLQSKTSEAAHREVGRLSHDDGKLRTYRVVDTIGLHDTTLPAAETIQRFLGFIEHVPHVDVFLFVLPWGRFKPEHEAAVDTFVAHCGARVLEHTVFVFTHCTLTNEELRAKLVSDAPAALRRVMPSLAYPSVVGVDLVAGAQSRGAGSRLRMAIDEACDSLWRPYPLEAIVAAGAQRGAEQEEEERAAFAAAVSDWRKGATPTGASS